MGKLLEVKSLKSWYGESQALFDINLQIEKGEIVALLGRNGMGKSTTINSICGMVHKYDGNINFNNVSSILYFLWKITSLNPLKLISDLYKVFNLLIGESEVLESCLL